MNKKIFFIAFIFFSFVIFGDNIDIEFINEDIKDALDDIAYMTNKQIVYSKNIKGTVDISIHTTNIETALELMLFGTPYSLKKYSEDIYFVLDYSERTNFSSHLLEPYVVKLVNINTNSISDLLNFYPHRVKFLKDSNLVIVYGKDDIAHEIINMIRDIDKKSSNNKVLAVKIIELSEDQWKIKSIINTVNDYVVGKDVRDNFEFLNIEENLRKNYYDIFKDEGKISFDFHNEKVDVLVKENVGFEIELLLNDDLKMKLKLNYSQINTPIYYFISNSNGYFMITFGIYEKNDYANYFQVKKENSIGLEYEFNIDTNYMGFDFLVNDYEFNFKYGFFENYQFIFMNEVEKDFYSKLGIKYCEELLYIFLSFKEYQYFEEIMLNGEMGLMSNIILENNKFIPSFDSLFYDVFIGHENDIIKLGVGIDINLNISEIILNPYSEIDFSFEYNKFDFIGELSYIINKGIRFGSKVLYNF